MKEALYYNKLDKDTVQCVLCPHECRLRPGQMGICSVRQNIDGKLVTHVYNRAIAVHVDPIEKKPLFHVAPGSRSFSMAAMGCNFHCKFCQNSSISQVDTIEIIQRNSETITAAQLVEAAKQQHCRSIAYTYTEPTIYYEYAIECAELAHQAGLLNIFVSNGYINPEPLEQISPVLDAANIDLKSFREDFYRKLVGAKLNPVLDTLRLMKSLKIFVEITTLIIPTHNDSEDELHDIARFIKQEMGEETPWHISRFYPQYKLTNIPPTPPETLRRARDIGLAEGLKYVYTGNVPGDSGESTWCPQCGELVIQRYGYSINKINLKNGCCAKCQTRINGIEMDANNDN
ncbi:AmmeMemoRadiSam system radical SAM enzyme [candidate division KSB1 bacterium]|nr:AmmeMemoRadiSam system radical SAM enzyme [candidate division KSB1 bacterium]